LYLAIKDRLLLYDFNAACLQEFDEIGDFLAGGAEPPTLLSIGLDLWFEVAADDLYFVIPLPPSLS